MKFSKLIPVALLAFALAETGFAAGVSRQNATASEILPATFGG